MSQLWIYTDDNSPDLVYEASSNWTVISKSETDGRNGSQSSLTYLGSRGILAEFNSTGTHVDVIGAIVLDEDTNKRLMLAFTLDGSTPAISVPTSAQNGTVATLFKSPRLSNDTHTLQLAVVEVDESAYDNVQTVQVHYVPVHQGSIYADATNATTSGPTPEGKSAVPVGPIVGGVVGGVALLVASVLAVYFLFIKPKRKNTRPYVYYSANLDEIDSEKPSIIPVPTPFTLTKSETFTASLSQPATLFSPPPSVTSPRSVDDVAVAHFVPYAPARSISHASTTSVPASIHLTVVNANEDLPQGPPGLEMPLSVAERKAREAGTRSSSLEIHQHRDSGYRFAAAGEASGSGSSSSTAAAAPSPVPDEVPPEYSAA